MKFFVSVFFKVSIQGYEDATVVAAESFNMETLNLNRFGEYAQIWFDLLLNKISEKYLPKYRGDKRIIEPISHCITKL